MNTTNTPTIKQCLNNAQSKLSSSDSESDTGTAKLEAEVLLAFALNKSRSHLYTWPEQVLDDSLVQRRYAGEPIAYITGVREFWGLPITVTPDTLIPRPETERLVEIALQHIPEDETSLVADLGTGSGAIALAIASERSNATIEASDVSAAAIAVAKANQAQLNLPNISFKLGRWFEAFTTQKFNLIVSNPPYVAERDPHLQRGDLRFEPVTALSSGPDGLEDIKIIIEQARDYLTERSCLLLEHGFDQADAIIDLFENSGYSGVQCFRDYGERERATIGRWLTY